MTPSKWDQDHPIWSEWSQSVPHVWMNGELVPFLHAQMPVMSSACRAGVNVFEGIRAYWNEAREKLYVFRMPEHYQRLIESMRIMHLSRPEGVAEMGAVLLDTLRANRFHTDVHVIHTVYLDAPGMEALGPIGMYVVARPRGRLYPLDPGITCGVSSWQRMPDQTTPFRAKSGGNYLNTRLGGVEARQHGYDAAIFLNTRGKVAEGGGACVFAIKKGVVITPSVTSDILESITRDTLIELMTRELGLLVEQRDVDRTELYVCDEAFFCGSGWEIVPIRAVDGFPCREWQGGATSQKDLRSLFQRGQRRSAGLSTLADGSLAREQVFNQTLSAWCGAATRIVECPFARYSGRSMPWHQPNRAHSDRSRSLGGRLEGTDERPALGSP